MNLINLSDDSPLKAADSSDVPESLWGEIMAVRPTATSPTFSLASLALLCFPALLHNPG